MSRWVICMSAQNKKFFFFESGTLSLLPGVFLDKVWGLVAHYHSQEVTFPGQVVWLNGKKCIRKLELNKTEEAKSLLETEPLRSFMKADECYISPRNNHVMSAKQSSLKQTPERQGRQGKMHKKDKKEDKNQAEQKITKMLCNILKVHVYLYF